jgi:hypothetical protein
VFGGSGGGAEVEVRLFASRVAGEEVWDVGAGENSIYQAAPVPVQRRGSFWSSSLRRFGRAFDPNLHAWWPGGPSHPLPPTRFDAWPALASAKLNSQADRGHPRWASSAIDSLSASPRIAPTVQRSNGCQLHAAVKHRRKGSISTGGDISSLGPVPDLYFFF